MDLSTYLMLRVSSDSKDARADGESSMLMMSVSPIPVVGGVWLSRACLPIQIPVFFSPVSGLVVFHFRGARRYSTILYLGGREEFIARLT